MKVTFLAWMLMLACCAAARIPVIGFQGAALTPVDLAHILDLSQKLTGPRAKIWFISAKKDGEFTDNQGRFASDMITLTVYLEPTTKSPRLRRGELIVVYNGEAPKTPRIQRAGRWIFNPDTPANVGSTYACVPREPGRFLNTPGHLVDLREGPFEIHRDPPFTDAEVIVINTAVRLNLADLSPDTDFGGMRGIIAQYPLTSLRNGFKTSHFLERLSSSPNDCVAEFRRDGSCDYILLRKFKSRWQAFDAGEVEF